MRLMAIGTFSWKELRYCLKCKIVWGVRIFVGPKVEAYLYLLLFEKKESTKQNSK